METSTTEMPVIQDSDEHGYILEMLNHLSDHGQAVIAVEDSSTVFFKLHFHPTKF